MKGEWQQKIKRFNRRRWMIWAPLGFAFLAVYFHRTATGVMADSLMQEFSITSAAEMGGLASVYFYTYAAMQLPAGILADFYGPRRTITLALLLATVGAVSFSQAESITALYIGRVLSSLGVGLIYVNIVKIHAEWFRVREFATMTGLMVMAGSAGFLLAATPLAFVVESYGWRNSFLMIAAYSLLVAACCWLLVRDRPAAVGLPSVAEVEAVENGITLNAAAETCIADSLKTVMRNPYTWWPFLSSVTVYGVYMAFMGLWGVPYFMQIYGMSRIAAANFIVVMAVGTMLGGPLIGVLSDRLGLRRAPNVWCTAGFLFVWLLLTVWGSGKPPIWALYPICFGMGVGMSGVNLNTACGKEVNPPHMTGIAAGVVNSGSFVGGALMQPIFGWVLDRHWQGAIVQGVRIYPLEAYQSAFWVCAAVLLLAIVSALLIKETRGVNICVTPLR
jgi:sugar phosphate permease